MAYDVASTLRPGLVPDVTFEAARWSFGDEGAAELVFLVSLLLGLGAAQPLEP